MLGFDISITGIGSLGAMILIAMVFICYCFAIHLIVTWNPYHRPVIPLMSSLILSIGPMLVMSMEKDGNTSLAEILELAFLFTSLGVGVIILWIPIILAFVTFLMLIVSRKSPTEDPLIDMLEN